MSKKSFFANRTVPQVKALDTREVYHQRGLVDKIECLNPESQAIILKAELIPRSFAPGAENSFEVARKFWKHGPYLVLSQPGTIEEALETQYHPLEIRRRDFDSKLRKSKSGKPTQEEHIRFLGYSFRPIQGPDKVKRMVPFSRILDGARLFAYASQKAGGIEVRTYDDSARVETEGGVAIVRVPSTSEKKERYLMRVAGFPLFDNPEQFSIAWGFRTTGRNLPEHKVWTFGYKFKEDTEQSNAVILDDKDVAAAYAIAAHYMVNGHNSVPWEMIPIAKPSESQVSFDFKLGNNVLVYDPTTSTKDHLRQLYMAERSILHGRRVALKGHDETMFWKAGRDSKLTDYVWNLQ